jgi:hypothetical protein
LKTSDFKRSCDKLGFFFGVINLLICAFLIGYNKNYFYIFHTLNIFVNLTVRTYRFTVKKWGFFMFDFCYYANYTVLAQLWFYPKNELLFMISFCISTGPLLWAVLLYRNSLVFHSHTKYLLIKLNKLYVWQINFLISYDICIQKYQKILKFIWMQYFLCYILYI